MPVVFLPLGLLALWCGIEDRTAEPRSAPEYSAASIVNAADNQSGELAPNTIATIYGKNLAYSTWALSSDDIHPGGELEIRPRAGVYILIGNLPANLYYVSPTQVNFLVPPCLLPGDTTVQLVRDSQAGQPIAMQLAAAAPALFMLDLENAVATRPDWSVLTPADPAQPGDVVVLYATGLGPTEPPVIYGWLPLAAARLRRMVDFKVLLDGVALDASAILYAGVAPGYAGLYQINLVLPAATGANPEIRIGLGETLSIPGVKLPVRPR